MIHDEKAYSVTLDERAIIQAFDGEQLMQDLETLGQIGLTDEGGLMRVAFSSADQQGRVWVEEQMRAAGMDVRRDSIGNSIATYSGHDSQLAPIVLASHTDTVPNGGKYDGALGVLAALSAVRTLHALAVQLRHPVEIVNFVAEEATMAGATLGSKAMAGTLDAAVFQQAAWDGELVETHCRAAGIDPEKFNESRRASGTMAAYLELHIEQGATLERDQIPIGIVTGIVSIQRYRIIVPGYANHAGTTPMDLRDDALVKTAPLITAVRDIAVEHGIVGTIGNLRVFPGAPNVIPGKVEIQVEFRGLDEAIVADAISALLARVEAIGASYEHVGYKEAVFSDERLLKALEASCDDQGIAHRRMPSAAGHDAMCIAAVVPQAMLFVPSHNGVSHAPDEYTEPEHCMLGARVLLGALLKLDEQLAG